MTSVAVRALASVVAAILLAAPSMACSSGDSGGSQTSATSAPSTSSSPTTEAASTLAQEDDPKLSAPITGFFAAAKAGDCRKAFSYLVQPGTPWFPAHRMAGGIPPRRIDFTTAADLCPWITEDPILKFNVPPVGFPNEFLPAPMAYAQVQLTRRSGTAACPVTVMPADDGGAQGYDEWKIRVLC